MEVLAVFSIGDCLSRGSDDCTAFTFFRCAHSVGYSQFVARGPEDTYDQRSLIGGSFAH